MCDVSVDGPCPLEIGPIRNPLSALSMICLYPVPLGYADDSTDADMCLASANANRVVIISCRRTLVNRLNVAI